MLFNTKILFMKRIYSLLTVLFLTFSLMAQVPDAFQYQAVVRDAEGNLRSNENVNVEISIIQGSPGGNAVYSENHSVSTDGNGVFSLVAGNGHAVSSDLSQVEWSNGPYFIEVTIDGTISVNSQLLSVPFAKYAEKSADSFSGQYIDLSGTPDLNVAQWDEASAWGDHHQEVEQLRKRLQMLEQMSGVGTVEDSEDNKYKTVTIGDQVWMAENLKATHYSDGTEITGLYWFPSEFTGDGQVNSEDSTFYVETYGFLYSWPATVKNSAGSDSNPSGIQGVCPDGWHVPSAQEWQELTAELGGYDIAGGRLKETGTSHWNAPNEGATNESGFSALPGGNRLETGFFYQEGFGAYYQTSTEMSSSDSHVYRMFEDNDNLSGFTWNKESGASVRCIKD
jgi:uncharacterized protein (TIGR02145 family)